MDFYSIDWNIMWQKESQRSPWNNRMSQQELWDKRATGFDKGVNRSKGGKERDPQDYISQMLHRIEVRPGWTVLDIGSGPGLLSIPLAKQAAGVTALDISPEMLRRLMANAGDAGLLNIECINASWQEAFAQNLVGSHDVVVASRSLMSGDMRAALSKIHAIARHAAYVTFPVVHLPFDWEVYRAIGRNGKKHPPYIYMYNMLYQMGIMANVEILYSKVKVHFNTIEDAIENLQWRTDTFTPEENEKLWAFLDTRFPDCAAAGISHEGYSQWALLWWHNDRA